MGIITEFAQAGSLPSSFSETAASYYLPLLEYLVKCKGSETLVLGINGTQGAGKSTLAEFLSFAASRLYGWQVTCLSLDDIYLTRSARESLSEEVHPLLRTRGVPGTHDIDLGVETLTKLCNMRDGESLLVPRFDKASDDQLPKSNWHIATGKQDLVIFEGWCLGCVAQLPVELDKDVNSLEATEDKDKTWRTYVNKLLAEYDERLWSKVDLLVMLKAPSFEQVYLWRTEQENKLVETLGRATELSDSVKMKRFICHYERLTKHMLRGLGDSADVLMQLDQDRRVESMRPDLSNFPDNQSD